MPAISGRARRLVLAWLLVLSGLLCQVEASAEPDRVLIFPTAIANRIGCESQGQGQRTTDPHWLSVARRVDMLVSDAVEDAGMDPELRIDAPGSTTERGGCIDETTLQSFAKQSIVVAPRIVLRDGSMLLRIVSAKPGAAVMRLSTQEISEKELDFRVVVMVSELLAPENLPGPKGTEAAGHKALPQPVAGSTVAKPRSQGKGVLALTSAVWGGAIGYSLQRAGSGSDDPRLTYPLILLGSALGLGASLVAAEEWDISVGEAWYLNAGVLWPAASGLLLANSYNVRPSTRRYVYGLLGSTAGLLMASSALTVREISEGGAVLTHSGGASGLLMGGLVDMIWRGSTDYVPYRGMGYGAGIGVVLGGLAATQVRLTSSRVLFIDLSAGVGALTGAAVGSPLLIFEDSDLVPATRQRAWLGLIGAGAIVGGAVGWYLTRNWVARDNDTPSQSWLWPYLTATPSYSYGALSEPATMGAGIQGLF